MRRKRVRLSTLAAQNSKGQAESELRKGFSTETIMTPLKANDEMEVMVLKDLAEICSTSTIFRRTGIVPRWIPVLGYLLGSSLLLGVGNIVWIHLVFPVWVFLVSAAILFENPSGDMGAIAEGE